MPNAALSGLFGNPNQAREVTSGQGLLLIRPTGWTWDTCWYAAHISYCTQQPPSPWPCENPADCGCPRTAAAAPPLGKGPGTTRDQFLLHRAGQQRRQHSGALEARLALLRLSKVRISWGRRGQLLFLVSNLTTTRKHGPRFHFTGICKIALWVFLAI